jgi:hypothetical protein
MKAHLNSLRIQLALVFGGAIACNQPANNQIEVTDTLAEVTIKNFNDSNEIWNFERYLQINNAIVSWDTFESYTYKMQEAIEGNLNPIAFSGTIIDIVKESEGYLFTVIHKELFSLSGKSYIAKIHASDEIFESIESKLPKPSILKDLDKSFCFIFHVNDVTTDLNLKDLLVTLKGELVSIYFEDELYFHKIETFDTIKMIELKR